MSHSPDQTSPTSNHTQKTKYKSAYLGIKALLIWLHLLPASSCSLSFSHSSLLFFDDIKQMLCIYCSFCLRYSSFNSPSSSTPRPFLFLCSMSPCKHDSAPAFSILMTCCIFLCSTYHHLTLYYMYLSVGLYFISSLIKERTLSYPLPYDSTNKIINNFLKNENTNLCWQPLGKKAVSYLYRIKTNKPTSNEPHWTEFKIKNPVKADLRKEQKKVSQRKFNDSSKIIQTFWFLPIQSHKETFSTLMQI